MLAADTAVVRDECILGKPRDREDAARMLRLLSGHTHRVLTAVALIASRREWLEVSESRVTFRPILEEEMLRYWRTGEPGTRRAVMAFKAMAPCSSPLWKAATPG